MSCNSPVIAFFEGFDSEGKILIKYGHSTKGGQPVYMRCGKCLGCRLEHSHQWAVRCLKELEYYSDACFVTLTYNNLSLPRSVNTVTGEIAPSIVRKHIVQFVKRLRISLIRKGYLKPIKVYYCGEYGDVNHRPHYHLLIFGFKPNVNDVKDVSKYKKDKFGFQLYISDFLNSLWYEKFECANYYNRKSVLKKLGYSKEKRELLTSRKKWHKFSRGFVTFGDVTFQSCSYVCRYILKKQTKSDNLLEAFEQEFLGVSNGIGLRWLQDNYKTVFANGNINYVVNGEIKHCPIPRYFIEKLKDIDEDFYFKVKKDAYANLLKRVDNFDEDSKKLDDLKSNEKYLHKVTYERFKRSVDNEENL